MSNIKYHIERNSVQETLLIPLYARLICSRRYPELFNDSHAEKICDSLDYDFMDKKKLMNSVFGLFGALEAAQRHNDLIWEIKDYLKEHPEAAVVNMGCGLDDTFAKVDNGTCHGYNIDFTDVIEVRNQLLPAGEREENIGCDLTDYSWMDKIDGSRGTIFFAAGVFYYLKKSSVKDLLSTLAERFPGGRTVFDSCNKKGAKMMTRTWLKQAGITSVDALFYLESFNEISNWSSLFEEVSYRSYMRGYQDIYNEVRPLYKMLIKMCDNFINMVIVRITFSK